MEEGKREGNLRIRLGKAQTHWGRGDEAKLTRIWYEQERKAIPCHTALQIKGISSLILAIPLKKFQIL